MSGVLLLVDEKVFVVFTECVWAWAYAWKCVYNSEKRNTVCMPADPKGR